jgi:phosphomannomutase
MSVKKVLAFDLDGTLAISKSALHPEMAVVLSKILETFDVCVISGGGFPQFKSQVIDNLIGLSDIQLDHLHLMPTCGTRYYRYEKETTSWVQKYAEDLTDEQKNKIREALETSSKSLGYWPENPVGEIIEDRDSQLTFSALGQFAKTEDKYAWDPDGSKKLAIRDATALLLPDLEVRAGGTTSIDVTRPGIDKAYGMAKLIEALGIEKEDILFFGDMMKAIWYRLS